MGTPKRLSLYSRQHHSVQKLPSIPVPKYLMIPSIIKESVCLANECLFIDSEGGKAVIKRLLILEGSGEHFKMDHHPVSQPLLASNILAILLELT